MPEEQLLPEDVVLHYRNQNKSLPTKGTDILDVWFDSGCTFSVLDGKTADLVIEGHDQYRGWFQSSLLLSLGSSEKASYKNIFCHGFVVDENGQKMSKSIGNVVSPSVVFEKDGKKPAVGVDVLRWWAAEGCAEIRPRCSVELLRTQHFEELQIVRRTLKFLAGCLSGYSEKNVSSYDTLTIIERYALHRLHRFDNDVWSAYNQYSYQNVVKIILQYLVSELSSVYFTCIKHR